MDFPRLSAIWGESAFNSVRAATYPTHSEVIQTEPCDLVGQASFGFAEGLRLSPDLGECLLSQPCNRARAGCRVKSGWRAIIPVASTITMVIRGNSKTVPSSVYLRVITGYNHIHPASKGTTRGCSLSSIHRDHSSRVSRSNSVHESGKPYNKTKHCASMALPASLCTPDE